MAGKAKKTGRPTKRTQAVVDKILTGMCDGRSLRNVCLPDDMPAPSTFLLWVTQDEDLSEQYTRAREMRADMLFDDIIDICDDDSRDWDAVKDNEGNIVDIKVIGEHVQRSKLKIDTRKWMMGKMASKKYGDKIDHSHTGQIAIFTKDDEQL